MAVAYVSKVVVFDEVLFVGGGLVNRWMRDMTVEFTGLAIDKCPVNKRSSKHEGYPGELRDSIRGDTNQVGPKQVEGNVSASAPYLSYVLRGTNGPIYSRKGFRWAAGDDRRLAGPVSPVTGKFLPGYWLNLPVTEFGSRRFHIAVSGQRANNFLFEAYDALARMHSSLRPFPPGDILNP